MWRAGLLVWLALWPAAVRAEVVDLSLPEARVVAQAAYKQGDVALAYALATRLVESNPQDAQALLILAAAGPDLGFAAKGRQAGKQAWRATKDAALRYEIARFTARAALAEGRPQVAQFWLRRAADYAATPDAFSRNAADVRNLRETTRLRYALDLSISPSDNLNNGATGGLLTIDDWFTVGPLSVDAQALSGVRAVGQAQVTYAMGETGRTVIGLRGYASVNTLSASSRAAVDGAISGSDLNMLQLEATLEQQTRLPAIEWPLQMTAAVGTSWAGGKSLGPHARIEAVTPLSKTDPTRLTLSAEVQSQTTAPIYGVTAGIDGQMNMPAGQMYWQLGVRAADGPRVNDDYHQVGSDLAFSFGRPIGPVSLSVRAAGSIRDYAAYTLAFANVTGGRQDRTASLGIDAVFQDMSIMGYAPRVSLTARATDSNISRFTTREIGLTIGIQSQF
jgi:hypothetical protein